MAFRRPAHRRIFGGTGVRSLVTALALAGLVGMAAAESRPPPAPAPVLEIDDAAYVGTHADPTGVAVFRGVPFAAAPVGEHRWRPPAPLPSRPGRHEALRFAPACIQGGYMGDWYRGVVAGFGGDPAAVVDPPESEDCLYLNVWRPAGETGDAGDAPLPVIVFIHGGGNAGGWSWEPNYDGQHLAAQGFVVVTIAYRLGVFGFFSHPDEPHANFGLLDQVAALRWIHTHADALGADVDRITVMGESSGGNNIVHLMALPAARDLFQRAVVQSAGWALRETPLKADQDPAGLALQEAVLGAGSTLRALRAADTDAVFAAARSTHASRGYDPVVDGVSLSESVFQSVNGGRLAPVDLLIGSNRDEWLMYLPEAPTLADLTDQGLPEAARAPATRLLEDGERMARTLDRVVTAWQMVCPSLHLAAAVARQGNDSWVYWFTRQREGDMAATLGAYHGAELPYVFDTHDAWLPTDADDRRLTARINAYWTAFARTGDPNPGAQTGIRTPPWPAYRGDGDDVQRLDTVIEPVHHPEWPLCADLGVRAMGPPDAPDPPGGP
ncbi:MAG: carboxylesterase family protein [Xanthomonadales bacterium]|jgi:para-nitrobenzyl esterase|nr:carboxylesterase family protein [Xanthomonadales bacterium]